jgi:hypothetical protein
VNRIERSMPAVPHLRAATAARRQGFAPVGADGDSYGTSEQGHDIERPLAQPSPVRTEQDALAWRRERVSRWCGQWSDDRPLQLPSRLRDERLPSVPAAHTVKASQPSARTRHSVLAVDVR